MGSPAIPFIGKILPPRQPGELVRRQRLLDLLHRNLDRSVITISAPAGYGKTTLAASFARDSELPSCWYTLDESDQEPGRLLRYLAASIQRRFPQVGRRTLAALEDARAMDSQYRQVVGTLVTEIYESIPEHCLLILDDLHAVEASQPVKATLDLLVTSAPENCRVLLLSRTYPALPSLPRMLANRQAARLTAEDLAFTEEEVSEFLQLLGVQASGPELQTLVEECEGWIAGIALRALGGSAPVSPGIREHLNGNQEWFDYAMSEVYGRLPSKVRAFLKRSSILYELRPSHCNAILSMSKAGDLLRALSESHQLVTRLEGEDLYRYHHLLQSFLVRLCQEDQAEFSLLHRRAGAYFGERGLWDAAIFHLCQGGAFEEAAEAIERAAPEVYETGQWARLGGWIDRLPEALLDAHPLMLIYRARAAIQMGEAETASRFANQALDILREGPDDLLAQAHVSRAAAFRLRGLPERCLEECQRAIRLIGEPRDRASRLALAQAYHYQAAACGQAGRFQEARIAAEEALQLFEALGDLYRISYAHHHLGAAFRALGDLGFAAAHYAQAQVGWQKLGNHARAASTLNNLANLYVSQGHLDLAEETLAQAANAAQEAGATRVLSYIQNSLGDVMSLKGHHQRAMECYQQSLKAARDASEHKNIVESTEGMALVYLALGDAGRAELLLGEARGLAGSHSGNEILGHLMTSQGAALHRLGRHEQARELLESALELLEKAGARGTLARCYFHLAALIWSQGQPGHGPLLRQVAKLLAQPGAELALLADARLSVPFVRHAATWEEAGEMFQRLLRGLADFEGEAAAEAAPAGREGPCPSVRAYSLGKTRVEVMTTKVSEVRWPSEKAKELLFYLLVQGKWVQKDEIITALWPEVDPAKGDTLFWTTSYRMRRGLYSDCLDRDASFYRLNPEGEFWLDAKEFEELVRQACDSTIEQGKIGKFEGALGLYNGPFLREVYSEWPEETRAHLQDRYLSALMLLARIWLDEGEFEKAADLSGRVLGIDPYQEEAYLLEMQALAQAGRVPEAHGTFRRYTQIVKEELQATPNQDIVDLYQQIVRGKLAVANVK